MGKGQWSLVRTPDTEEALLGLQRYFLLSYREEARARYPLAWRLLPLASGARLDLVAINGGRRAHFFYRATAGEEDVTYIHDVTVAGAGDDEETEARFLGRQFKAGDHQCHFAVKPPWQDHFERVGRLARRLVPDHARQFQPAP
jgi:hypothetical protein